MARKFLSKSKILQKIQFNDSLNPQLWEDEKMKIVVRIKLLQCALAFYRYVDLKGLKVTDIILTGSNANFNYTENSDADIHLIVQYPDGLDPDTAENLFKTKKFLWEYEHAIHISNAPVEMYVEVESDQLYAAGVYSVLKDKWLRKPSKKEPSINDDAVVAKVDHIAAMIDDTLEDERVTPEKIKAIHDKIKHMRLVGLENNGEFSVDNLAFKALRSLGYMERLDTLKNKILDKKLSLN